MNEIPYILEICKYIMLSITLYIFTYSFIKENIKFHSLIKFLLITSISYIFFILNINYFICLTAFLTLCIFGFKITSKLTYKKIIIPFFISYCFYHLILNVYLIIANQINSLSQLVNNPVYFIVTFIILAPLSSLLLLFAAKKYLKDNFYLDNVHILNTKFYTFKTSLLVFFTILLSYLNPYNFMLINNNITINTLNFIICINLLTFGTIILSNITIHMYFNKRLIEIENNTLLENCENLKTLNEELRSLKHDFLNHLQVILGLLQLKKYSECLEYVNNISNSEKNLNSIKTGLIPVNALLNSKQLRAKHRNIKLDMDICSTLDPSTFNLKDWEITRILGNLVDNAIHEEDKVSTNNKYVKVKVEENKHFYNFSVYNKNSYINSDKKKNIFDSGFSTKGKDGNGMGLYIIKNIVDKYKGTIELDSNINSGTQFSIYFPKDGEKTEEINEDLQSYPPQKSLGTQNI